MVVSKIVDPNWELRIYTTAPHATALFGHGPQSPSPRSLTIAVFGRKANRSCTHW